MYDEFSLVTNYNLHLYDSLERVLIKIPMVSESGAFVHSIYLLDLFWFFELDLSYSSIGSKQLYRK